MSDRSGRLVGTVVGVDFEKVKSCDRPGEVERLTGCAATHALARVAYESNSESNIDSRVMKRAMLCCWSCTVVRLSGWLPCRPGDSIVTANTQRSGFLLRVHVTGDKSAETTAAIRRYQIRNGLQVTGELNEETLRAVNSSSNSVASASQPALKPSTIQPNSVRPDVSAPLSQSSPPLRAVIPPTKSPAGTNPPYWQAFINPRRFE